VCENVIKTCVVIGGNNFRTILRQINRIPRSLIPGNEKVVLDFTFLKMVIANPVKFSCFTMKRGRDFATYTTNPQQIGPVADNPTIA
jgi:hypothetical protein